MIDTKERPDAGAASSGGATATAEAARFRRLTFSVHRPDPHDPSLQERCWEVVSRWIDEAISGHAWVAPGRIPR